MSEKFDIAIIGSGIAGAALATILARQGKKVIVFEAKEHPRFAIGESMILESSEVLRAMAEFYDVPELAYYSSEYYMPLIGSSHGVKRHFSFLHHSSGKEQDVSNSFQAVIPKEPYGHELHLHRQDSDYFIMTTAISYGATVLQNTPVKDINITEDHVEIHTKEEVFIADYIVDSGGYKSLLAEKYQLRDRNLKTHSRAIFTHMVDVPDFHHVSNTKDDYGFPFSVAEGTLHHIFDGGWMWVIPFNNHEKSTNPLCSVGLMLDPHKHPENKELSAKEEFCDFIAQFPDMARQFSQAKAVRPWTRTGRIQYSSKQVVGDRFALLGHAAGFIDPLFSKGMYVSLSSAFQLAHLLLSADENYSTEHFKGFETRTLNFVQSHDRLVANSYKSFANHKLWNVYLILWLLGAYTELVKLMSSRILAQSREDYIQQTQHLELVGGGFDAFKVLEKKVNRILESVDPYNEKEVDRAVFDITVHFDAIEWLPQAFQEVLKGKNHLPEKKLNADLFQRDSGFLGKASYRKHFFGDISATELVKIFMSEKNAYSEKKILGMK